VASLNGTHRFNFFVSWDTDFGNGRMSLENTLLTQLKSNVQIFDALRQNLL
jgi:hypothetical protein